MKSARIFVPLIVAGLLYVFSTSAQAFALSPDLALNTLQAAPTALLYRNTDINLSAQTQSDNDPAECHDWSVTKPAGQSPCDTDPKLASCN